MSANEINQSVVLRETAVNAAMGSVFSMLAFYLTSGGQGPVSLSQDGDFAFDFLIQGFCVGLFSMFMPQLLVSKAIRKGKLLGTPQPLAKALLRSVLWAIGSCVVFGGMAYLLSSNLGPSTVSLATALIIKGVFAVLLAVIFTSIALRPLRAH